MANDLLNELQNQYQGQSLHLECYKKMEFYTLKVKQSTTVNIFKWNYNKFRQYPWDADAWLPVSKSIKTIFNKSSKSSLF